eukprot:scaffold90350_cov48-Prasinocladus_malaysianus.AAC.1
MLKALSRLTALRAGPTHGFVLQVWGAVDGNHVGVVGRFGITTKYAYDTVSRFPPCPRPLMQGNLVTLSFYGRATSEALNHSPFTGLYRAPFTGQNMSKSMHKECLYLACAFHS